MKLRTMRMLIVFTVIIATISFASDKKDAKAMKMGKSKFLVITTHTEAECMNLMNDMADKDKAFLGKTWFGCMSGDHTGYSIVDAKDEDAVKDMLPADLKANAKIVKVSMFTPKMIKKMHEHMEKKS